VRLVGLALDPSDQVPEVARHLGQSALAEARVDAAFEMCDGHADVVSG